MSKRSRGWFGGGTPRQKRLLFTGAGPERLRFILYLSPALKAHARDDKEYFGGIRLPQATPN